MRFDLISIFPEYLAPLKLSLLGKAQEKGVISINVHDLRDQTTDAHHSVDDTPYGGGAGMVMSAVVWGDAIDQVSKNSSNVDLVILTPAGKKFDQRMAEQFSKSQQIIFACGRYEGIDARVGKYYRQQKNFRVHEVSIGDYVLGGGEVAAMVIIEATARLIPGVLGNPESLKEESHSLATDSSESLVEYPNYTKPASWRGLDVPEILLSGNHGEIAKWRRAESERRTQELETE
ncbi:MAG: tRNA (guanosine(37)-N1)-methyltransferase TrmD [Actinobacteria bacterium]|nr:tRNA (guanosine(37)-N1)-methyltransferase TrmD [Actinomycetota bacterium]NBY83065.1 tRNA (guanosine(37)-N1)-methyltransferase TrmD [Actinomycetota bacterium]NCA25626.1 tRNA (guanosine(37)-N1)-methyltransferase TrmD [Actinomycetota bacterium]NCU96302.1 tRNA (guanosine(37)-N1)-methyltransferase TrmD [Actinomycetota bacterium]NCZ76605.1 tRNA (guanosine(37)-N1)-methyltransferase TrmD [Actinomycetota bacterium]